MRTRTIHTVERADNPIVSNQLLSDRLSALSPNPISPTQNTQISSPVAAEASRAPRAARPPSSPFFGQHSRSRTSNPSHIVAYTPTLTSFPHFPHLPFELRLRIWTYALTTPRIILFASTGPRIVDPHPSFDTKCMFRTSLPYQPRALLECCRESRFEARKVYESAFGHQLGKPIWFARATDVLMFLNGLDLEYFFARDWMRTSIDQTEKEKVVNVAVMIEDDWIMGEWARERQVVRARDLFRGLALLVFVCVDGGMLAWDGMERLVRQGGELARFLEGVTARKGERGWEDLDVVDFKFKDVEGKFEGI